MSPALAVDASTGVHTVGPQVAWLRDVGVLIDGASPTLDVAARVLAQFGAKVQRGTAEGSSADVVLVDRIAAPTGIPGQTAASAADYAGHVERVNRGVWVTATAYGLATPRADLTASDLTLLAAGGILGHSRSGEELAPTVPPGNVALKLVGYVMAVAALHALHLHRTGGRPIHVDVAGQDAVIATGLTLEMAHALSRCPDEGGSARYGAPSGFFECADGSIYVLVLEQHQWQAFQAALAPAVDGVKTLADARDNADFVNRQLAEWAAARSVEECERLLQEAGVPCSEVNSLATLEARARAVGRPVDFSGPDAPPLPAQIFARDAEVPVPAPAGPIPLSSLRVLDAGHVLAVPLGAAWLGVMGAAVTKLEDPGRLDIYRRRGPFVDGREGLNRSAYFNQLNFSKRRLEVRVGEPGAGPDLGEFDVVMHNLTPKRARAVGVDLGTSLAHPSPKLAIASSGFGGNGPWANYRAYGHNIHAFAGLVAATRDAKGGMGDMGTPWADPLTSVAVAAWVLAWSLDPEHRSAFGIDISMAELTAAQISDLNGQTVDEMYAGPSVGGDFFVRSPGNGSMHAVSLRTPVEVSLFETLAGQPLPPRVGLGELIDVALSTSDVARLRAAGVPTAPVLTAHQLVHDPELRESGLFATVTSGDVSKYEVTGLPWRVVGQDRFTVHAAPEVPGPDKR